MKMKRSLQGSNLTSYAKSLGYAGSKQVIVLDGKVVSHRDRDWYLFCDELRSLRRRD